MKKRFVNKNLFANLFLALTVLISGTLLFWMVYPYDPLYIETPVKILTPVVSGGDDIIASFTFNKKTSVTPEISMSLVDGVVYNIPAYKPINVEGVTKGKVIRVLQLPDNIPCGVYHLHWVAEYQMNPIRVVQVKYESEEFLVESPICTK